MSNIVDQFLKSKSSKPKKKKLPNFQDRDVKEKQKAEKACSDVSVVLKINL